MVMMEGTQLRLHASKSGMVFMSLIIPHPE
jgi:hypothetical protein